MFTVDSFKSLLDKENNSGVTNRTHIAIILEGTWKWRSYKTYNTDFGWCIYPADAEAKEAYRRAGRFPCCFANVVKADGTSQMIRVPVQVFDKQLFWFEYGKQTLKQFESKVRKENKERGWTQEIIKVKAEEIPSEWWL